VSPTAVLQCEILSQTEKLRDLTLMNRVVCLFRKGPAMDSLKSDTILAVLNHFRVEIPSWGFANTGTRFGKFIQPAAATTSEEKFSDAAEVHRLTGACPTMALHVEWDLPNGLRDVPKVQKLAEKCGVRPGSLNPNVFQDQE